MDNSGSSLGDGDRSKSWSIINANNMPEDETDFEILKNVFSNFVQESTSSEKCDVDKKNVIPTVTTFPNKENREENNLTNSPNEEETCVLEDFNHSTSSLSLSHIVKEKIPEFDVEKNDPKVNCTKRKSRYKCPFLPEISLGNILSVCGLSLIQKSSEKLISCPENKNVTAINLDTFSLEGNSFLSSILEKDRLIRKYSPNKYNLDVLNNKNIRTKLVKRAERQMKQISRGYAHTNLVKRINEIKDENLQFSNIIKEQEKLVESIQANLNCKKRLYEKRERMQQNLENHLQLFEDYKILTAKQNIVKEDDSKVCALTSKMSDKLLDEILELTIKNCKTKNESDR